MTASLFQTALADRWKLLPPEVRAFHSAAGTARYTGRADITRGRTLAARIAASLFGFPPAGTDVPVVVTITRAGAGETWQRDFDGRILRSTCLLAPGRYRYRERFGPFTYEMDLPVRNGAMRLPVRRSWFLGVPLPRWSLPASDAREYAADGRFRFDIRLSAPLGGGLLVHYRGWLLRDGAG